MTSMHARHGVVDHDVLPGVTAQSVLDAVIDATDDVVIAHDSTGAVRSWNVTAQRCFGYTADEILGRPLRSLFAAHAHGAIEAALATVLNGGVVHRVDMDALRGDSMPMPVSVSARPIFDDDTLFVAGIVVVRDITEQRLAQATLAEVESRIRASEAMAGVGSWLWDVRSGTVQWSHECHRIHGVDPLDFDGTFDSLLSTIHPDDRGRVKAALEAAVVTSRPFDDEYRALRGSEHVVVHARAEPTTDSSGIVLALRGIVADVTARHLTERAGPTSP